jgi:RNA polymerase-binding transcription factor DksA
MNLKLYITKREIKHYNTRTKTKHLFAVIDLDKSKQYPQNFVSVLPKKINAIVKPANIFEEIFGNKSLELANQLLEKALRSRPDLETTQAIRERLKLLDPQQYNKTKCENCGNLIKQSKRKYRPYKFCFDCHSKRYLKK